jgi:hypothetical protein
MVYKWGKHLESFVRSVLWIEIFVHLDPDPDPDPGGQKCQQRKKVKKFKCCFEILDVFF